MAIAGQRSVEVAKRNGWWTIFDQVEDLIEPPVLSAALDTNAIARATWDKFPPSARKPMLWWVVSAATDETKARRSLAIVEQAAQGKRALG